MQEIKYKDELIQLIKEFTKVNVNVVIEPSGDNILIKRQDKNNANKYCITCPKEYFSVEKNLYFSEFNDFYNFYKCFKAPKLYYDDTTVCIADNSGNSSLKYTQTNTKSIKKDTEFNPPPTIYPNIKFKLSKEDLSFLKKMIYNLKSNYVVFQGDENELVMKTAGNDITNIYSKRLDFEKLTDFEPFYINISALSLNNYLPNYDYIIELNVKGVMKLSTDIEKIHLDFYTFRTTQGLKNI